MIFHANWIQFARNVKFFVSKDNLFDVYFTTVQLVLVPCGGGRTSLHTADYISFPSGSWAHCGIFENGVLLMYTLEGVSSAANFISVYEES